MESKLICSVCKRPLQKYANVYRCEDGHSYDIAKEGYVNLILANNKNSKEPGDNREMMLARRNFLNSGAYDKLLEEIATVLKSCVCEDSVIVESGCGEGFYISSIKNFFPKTECFGFDISKEAIRFACKRTRNVNFFVSSSYNCNIKSNSADIALVIFAPFVELELDRILSDSGTVVLVKPRAEHLLELKQQFYEQIKPVKVQTYKKFYVYKTINVSYNIYPSKDNLENLLKMTPFYYQVNDEKKQKLSKISLEKGIKVDFFIEVLKKMKI